MLSKFINTFKPYITNIIIILLIGTVFYFKNIDTSNVINKYIANPYTVSMFLVSLGDDFISEVDKGSFIESCKDTMSKVNNGRVGGRNADFLFKNAGDCAFKILSNVPKFSIKYDLNKDSIIRLVLLNKCDSIKSNSGFSQEQIFFMHSSCQKVNDEWLLNSPSSFEICKKAVNSGLIQGDIQEMCIKSFLEYMFELRNSQ